MDILLAILIDIHIGAIIMTLYFHRYLTHQSIIFTPVLEHIFRFLAWLNGWDWPHSQKIYVAQHRKHHRYSDTEKDPHSPHHIGFFGTFDMCHTDPNRPYYLTPEEVEKYAPDIMTPTDWIQRKIYDGARFNVPILNIEMNLSYLILFLIFWPFFGVAWSIALVIFHHAFLQRYFVPLHNYVSHKGTFDYVKNHPGNDKSKVIFPISIWLAGEELHANHHCNPGDPKFSQRWFEFDMGWVYIKVLSFLGLLEIKKHQKQIN